MEQTLRKQVLENIDLVYSLAKDSKLDNTLFELAYKELSFLSAYFHTTNTQALFLSIFFAINFNSKRVDLDDLIRYFSCNSMKLLEFYDDLNVLYEKKLIRSSGKRNKNKLVNFAETDERFYVNEIICCKIFKSENIPDKLSDVEKVEDIFMLLEKLFGVDGQAARSEISTKEKLAEAQDILEENMNIPLVYKTNKLGITIEEQYLFLLVLWKFIAGERLLWVDLTFKEMYNKPHEQFIEIQKFLGEENNLIKDNWLQIEDATFFDEAKIRLTEKALNLLCECDIKLFNQDLENKKNVIKPINIPFRTLIFGNEEEKNLNLLKSLLSNENFSKTQERLLQKGLPKGITILLYGAPGTGKTETVLQISKFTNREIMKIDISSSRSKWFGESEKLITQVFKDYKAYAKKREIVPILFFNEADAIISKRNENNHSTTKDKENRIQNILLEEIENFEGILIATTNLASNMDAAFERRFLFKIEFKKPCTSAKTQIWKSKLPQLSIEDCELLANKYNFSGGQIDNVVRKNEINEIIYGSSVDVNTLLVFCNEETLNNKYSKTPIGFKTHN